MDNRLSWDAYFLGMAKFVSQRSTCPTKQVGAVIVDRETNVILSTGYNGSPRGTSHCGDDCANREIGVNSKVCKAIHSEMNAILNSAFNGVKLRGAKCYVTISPCLSCARGIIQAGIVEVVCAGKSPYDRALDLLKEAGVKVRIISGMSFPKVRVVGEPVSETITGISVAVEPKE